MNGYIYSKRFLLLFMLLISGDVLTKKQKKYNMQVYQTRDSVNSQINNVNITEWYGANITCIGTSITAYGKYVASLNAMLNTTIQNLGYGAGSVSSSSVYNPSKIYDEIANINVNSDLVLLEIGINDFRGNATLGTINDTTLSTWYGSVYRIVTDILDQDKARTVVLLTPYGNIDTSAAGRWDNPNDNGNTLLEFINAMKEVALKIGVPCFDIGANSGINGKTNTLYCYDGIHLNDLGGVLYAKTVKNLLFNIPKDGTISTVIVSTWDLHAVTLPELSGTNLTINSLGVNTVIDVTKTETYGVLWLATGLNNAAEWQHTGGDNAWFCYGQGSSGWIGSGDYKSSGGQFSTSGLFQNSNSALTTKPPPSVLVPYENSVKYRAARIGNNIYYQEFRSEGWVTVINQDLTSINNTAGYQDEIKIGLLIGLGTYNISNVKVGNVQVF